ncbi:MAG: glycogen synthase GlgA [bacterium]
MKKELKVLFLSSEVVPYAKTGGLADVAGALPAALRDLGADVRVALPLYASVRKGGFSLSPVLNRIEVPLGNTRLGAAVWETASQGGTPVYLLEREDLYERPNLYGNPAGDYYDNLERFSFFCHGVLLMVEAMGFRPDLIHCNDWQTGLVPALLAGPYRHSPVLGGVPSVFTIHNLGYQGIFPAEKLQVTGLPMAEFFHPEGLEFWGNMSLLKAGIVYSRAITTVSPTYAREIQTPEFGLGMEGILYHRRDVLRGILNGVDYSLWDPATDPHLPANYYPGKMTGKTICKEELIKETGLDPRLKKRPLLGMTTRMAAQKGLDLLTAVLQEVLDLDVGLVILGTGEDHYQRALQEAAKANPSRLAVKIGFDEALAHRIMAGVDIFLIPSRYEPCGLTQMYAFKYGTVPLVRATGGLQDTVRPFDVSTGQGNGFKFGPHEPKAFLECVRQAVSFYEKPQIWRNLVLNGLKEDFSWDRSAREYLELYDWVCGG